MAARRASGTWPARQGGGGREREPLRVANVDLLGLDPQPRGYRLQSLLEELFSLFDLDPKASFGLDGEQTDGAFSFQSADCLLEAKRQQEPGAPSGMRDCDGKTKNK